MDVTPRTDALLKLLEDNRYTVFEALLHLQEHARQLERELNEAQRLVPSAIAATALAAELEKLGSEATEGPWAWDQRGEKINEWGMGVAFTKDEKPIAGHFIDEDAIYVEQVCQTEGATVNCADPELICLLRNNLPAIIAALRGHPSSTEPYDELRNEIVEECAREADNYAAAVFMDKPTNWFEREKAAEEVAKAIRSLKNAVTDSSATGRSAE